MRNKKIKIPPKFWKPLKYKIKFDWKSFWELEKWQILEEKIKLLSPNKK